jgi:hypothetical protein
MGGLFSKENPYVRKANLSGYVPVIEFKAYKDYAGNKFLSQSTFNAYKTQMGDDFQAFKDYSGKGFTSQSEFMNYKKIVDDFLVEYKNTVTNVLPATYQAKGDYVNSQSYNKELKGVLARFDSYQPKGDYVTINNYNTEIKKLSDSLNNYVRSTDYNTDMTKISNTITKYLPDTYQPKGNYATTNELNNLSNVYQPKGNYALASQLGEWTINSSQEGVCLTSLRTRERGCVPVRPIPMMRPGATM